MKSAATCVLCAMVAATQTAPLPALKLLPPVLLKGEPGWTLCPSRWKLKTELYPDSSNTYDSLAEALLLSGDKAGALAAFRKVLEALPQDTKTPPAAKDPLRRNAEAKIKELAP